MPDTNGRPRPARELNEQIKYVMWSVFRRDRGAGPIDRTAAAAEADECMDKAGARGVDVRGAYDLSGMRADADYLLWWSAPRIEDLQETYTDFRHTAFGATSVPVWSAAALHRPAEFNKSHVPAYLAEEPPRLFVCVYPFVRSLDWYLLDPAERRTMLAEHGKMAREYPDVRANTVAAFALGDYEWILALEADDLHRLVDLMRHLRASKARLHTREEVPFFTGRRRPLRQIVHALP